MKKIVKKDTNRESLQKETLELQSKIAELEGNWKRALADYQNYKRRSEQERIELVKYANENLMREIVGVLGNFDLLVKHSEDPGLKITVNNFIDVLKRNGLEEIESTGKVYNAEFAEAIEIRKGKKDEIIETLDKGYTYNGKLIKPARVVVGSGEK